MIHYGCLYVHIYTVKEVIAILKTISVMSVNELSFQSNENHTRNLRRV